MKRKLQGVATLGQELLFDLFTMAIVVAVPTAVSCIVQMLFGTLWLSIAAYVYTAWKMIHALSFLDKLSVLIATKVREAVPADKNLVSFKVLELNPKDGHCKLEVKVEDREPVRK